MVLLKVSQCRVTSVTTDGQQGLHVTLLPRGLRAFVPKMHLSDYLTSCDQLMSIYRVGVVIDEVMYFGTTKTSLVCCFIQIRRFVI